MGKLIDPGLGELLDRYSILDLKMSHSFDTGQLRAFQAESLAIERKCFLKSDPTGPAIRLAVTNALLWRQQDALVAATTDVDLAAVARRIRQLNWDRAELVHKLNELANGKLPKEKI